MTNFIPLLAPDFALIACGALLCRHTALDRRVWEPVEALVYYFLFPVLLFQAIISRPLDLGAMSGLMGAGVALALTGIALAYSLPYWPIWGKTFDPRRHAASAQVAFRFNSFIALALSQRLLGSEGLALVSVLVGVCVPIFNTAAVWPMAKHSGRGFGRELARNPLIIGTLSGLLANLGGLSIPEWMAPTLERIGQSSLPLGLMAAGAGMRLASLAQAKRLATAVLFIKHASLPLAAWAMGSLFGLNTSEQTVLLLFSAVPTASSCYVLATRMGYDGPYVASLVTVSTALAALSLPMALALAGV
ncbi:AEC family transporter [Hydrogenophaga sp. 5NK40-0174]|uniref:AEC family transporter n=1 Tax=Hydrogenophaga sp. 5NK40-0174 TaxID=3127649 RepID=UPI003108218C